MDNLSSIHYICLFLNLSIMVNIISLTDSWGTQKGGINSFNYDLLCSLAKLDLEDLSLYCVVLNIDKAGLEDAEGKGIKIINLKSQEFSDAFVPFILKSINGEDAKNYFIGHDVISGKIAYECKFQSEYNSKFIAFHHMSYESYEPFKINFDPYKSSYKKSRQEIIFSNADIIFGVGPKLYKSAMDLVDDEQKSKCKMFIPGLPEIKSNQKLPNKFIGVCTGRLEYNTDYIKLFSLTVCALKKAILECGEGAFYHDSKVELVGLEKDLDKSKIQDIKNHISSQLNIFNLGEGQSLYNIVPYKEDREEIFTLLKRSTVALMLSIHEGSGLAGWEAIAAGIPLVVSKNSGLYEFLDDSFANQAAKYVYPIEIKGDGKTIFSQQDLENVSEAIKTINNQQSKWKEYATSLKKMLTKKYSWKKICISFLCDIGEKEIVKPLNSRYMIKVVTPHENYGSTHLLKKACKRIWLDAIIYPYYSKTGDYLHYQRMIQKNDKSEVNVIFPTEELVKFHNDHFNGYAGILRKGEYSEEDLLIELRTNIKAFKSIKNSLKAEDQNRFKLFECNTILFHPFVLIDNTMLTGYFSHSACVAPYGTWMLSDISDKIIYEKDILDIEDPMEQAIKRLVDEFQYRLSISKEIK